MPKKLTLTQRIEAVERGNDDLREELQEIVKMVEQIDKAFEKHQAWMSNGFSDKVAAIIAVKMAEQQAKQWEREREERRIQLEEQREKNKEYGEKKDRQMKWIVTVLTVIIGPVVVTAITLIVQKIIQG